jgi:uncharacterized protein (TIRG00374 family)
MLRGRRATILGFAIGIGILAALVWAVGTDRVLDALALADPVVLLGVAAAAACWLTAWGLGLWVVIRAVDGYIHPWTAIALYAAAAFANNVTPFGQAGGEPLSALLISRVADTEYEKGLAAIASVDALNVLPAVGLALGGLAYYTTQITLGRRLRLVTVGIAGIGVAIVLLGTVGWRYRRLLARRVARIVTPIAQTVCGIVPRLTPPGAGTIRHRIEQFVDAIERVREDRRQLLIAIGLATAGWIAQICSLWLALYAVDVTVTPAAVAVAIPVGAMASATPAPGGLGGIEATLVGVLVATAGVAIAPATAAVLLHRVGIYLLPTAGGGVAAFVLGKGTA